MGAQWAAGHLEVLDLARADVVHPSVYPDLFPRRPRLPDGFGVTHVLDLAFDVFANDDVEGVGGRGSAEVERGDEACEGGEPAAEGGRWRCTRVCCSGGGTDGVVTRRCATAVGVSRDHDCRWSCYKFKRPGCGDIPC